MVPGVPVRLAVGVPVVSLVVLLTLVRGVAVTVPPVHPPAWLTLPVFPPVSSLQSGVLPDDDGGAADAHGGHSLHQGLHRGDFYWEILGPFDLYFISLGLFNFG